MIPQRAAHGHTGPTDRPRRYASRRGVGMSEQCGAGLARRRVPEADRALETAGGDGASVRAEGHGRHPVGELTGPDFDGFGQMAEGLAKLRFSAQRLIVGLGFTAVAVTARYQLPVTSVPRLVRSWLSPATSPGGSRLTLGDFEPSRLNDATRLHRGVPPRIPGRPYA